MERQISKGRGIVRTSIYLILAAIVAGAGGGTALTASGPSSSAGIVGTWLIQITPRVCATSAPAGASFSSIVTFHHDGTIAESAGSLAFEPGQRTDAHGGWSHAPEGRFNQRMVALILFETAANLPGTPTFDPSRRVTPGFEAGWQTITHSVTVDSEGRLRSSGTNAFFRTDGTQYRSGCSTAVGDRFE